MIDKNKLKKILKVIWKVTGIFLVFLVVVFYIKAKTFHENGISAIGGAIGISLIFAVLLFVFLIYLVITIIILSVKNLMKNDIQQDKNT